MAQQSAARMNQNPRPESSEQIISTRVRRREVSVVLGDYGGRGRPFRGVTTAGVWFLAFIWSAVRSRCGRHQENAGECHDPYCWVHHRCNCWSGGASWTPGGFGRGCSVVDRAGLSVVVYRVGAGDQPAQYRHGLSVGDRVLAGSGSSSWRPRWASRLSSADSGHAVAASIPATWPAGRGSPPGWVSRSR